MRSFTQLEEGLLAGQDATLKTGDKISKKMAEVEAIKKNLVYLDIIWNNTYGGSKYTQDAVGTDINIGDVVLFTDEDVTNNLNIHTEAEYYMSEEQIVELLKNGSHDAFLDCLDYAPVGVIDLLKKYAVSLPVTDINKRKALKDKTGFDVDVAIKNIEAEKAEDAGAEDNQITPVEKTATPTGRRATTNYKVVSKVEETKAE
jgi:hypothetical protein